MDGWPEDDWERLTDYVAVDADAAAELVGEPVLEIAVLTGGKANTNYRLDLADGPVVLRLFERDASARDRERRVIELTGQTLPTPKWLADGEVNGVPYAVLSFVVGEHPHHALAGGADPARLGRSIGANLRALENVTPPGNREVIGLLDANLGFERTFESVADSFVDLISWSLREGRCGKRLGTELRSELAAGIDRAARALEPVDAWRGLAHGDYKFSNLLVRDEELVAVLDWEFTCAFTPLLDVAIHMRHRDNFPPAYVEGFEQGHGALPDDWRRLSRIMDLMNLVGFLNASGDRPTLFDAVKSRIAATIALL